MSEQRYMGVWRKHASSASLAGVGLRFSYWATSCNSVIAPWAELPLAQPGVQTTPPPRLSPQDADKGWLGSQGSCVGRHLGKSTPDLALLIGQEGVVSSSSPRSQHLLMPTCSHLPDC